MAPFAEKIISLTYHTNSKVRLEEMHAVALLAPKVPEVIFQKWEHFAQLILDGKSVIVRDYVVTTAGNPASRGANYANVIYPFLLEALTSHNTHHA